MRNMRSSRNAPDDSMSGESRPSGPQRLRRRRECRFCKEKVDHIDYKNADLLIGFVPERGKILPRRLSGVCTPHQRMLGQAIKRARAIALLPYVAE